MALGVTLGLRMTLPLSNLGDRQYILLSDFGFWNLKEICGFPNLKTFIQFLQDFTALLTRCSYSVNLHTRFHLLPVLVLRIFCLALFTELPAFFFTTGHPTQKFSNIPKPAIPVYLGEQVFHLLKLETQVISTSPPISLLEVSIYRLYDFIYTVELLALLRLLFSATGLVEPRT